MDYGRITNSFKAHDDVVSCLSLVDSENLGLLVSGSWDCSVKYVSYIKFYIVCLFLF